jgi:hypothetical protein
MKSFALSVVALCIMQTLPSEAQAQQLIPAHPMAPVAFTYPPLRDYTKVSRARRNVARARARRRSSHHTYIRARVSRSYGVSDWGYHSLLTGWRPLPYEFGPYSARVVVLR